jgi:hypothetical protein
MYNRITNSDTVVEHFQNGLNLQRQGLLEEAALQFLRVIELNRHSANAYFNMGAICFRQHQYEEAIRHYKAGLEITPQNVSAYADLGKTYEMLGKWDEALECLNNALDLNPNHEAAQRRTRRILAEKHKYGIIWEHAKSVIESISGSDNINVTAIERFVVNFDKEVSEETQATICRLLVGIYTELGSKFDYYPQQNIEVFVFHTLPQKEPQLLLPQWATGRYDGSIAVLWREPHKADLGLLYVVLRHEYVHLLVNMLTNGQCPTWLNEGLAGYYARELLNSEKEILLQIVEQNRYIPLKYLEHSFNHLNKSQIRLAYMESCSTGEFMVETYGMMKLKKLLHLLGMDKSFNESLIYSLKTGKMAPQKELETQWLTWVMDCYK